MKKAANRRAFFVYLFVCAAYVVVAFKLPEKVVMKRVSDQHRPTAHSMSVQGPRAEAAVRNEEDASLTEALTGLYPGSAQPAVPAKASGPDKGDAKASNPVAGVPPDPNAIEPSLLIAAPLVCRAITAGWIDRDGLIFFKKDAYNSGDWKKPLDILKDREAEGIRSVLAAIGKERLREFLTKEGITVGKHLSAEEVVTGRGYTVQKKALLALYDRHVGDGCAEILPFYAGDTGVARGRHGYQIVYARESARAARTGEEKEWLMPNLVNLPMRAAIEKLAPHTSKIRLAGSGIVVSQSPRPFERLRGETEVSIQGRLYSE